LIRRLFAIAYSIAALVGSAAFGNLIALVGKFSQLKISILGNQQFEITPAAAVWLNPDGWTRGDLFSSSATKMLMAGEIPTASRIALASNYGTVQTGDDTAGVIWLDDLLKWSDVRGRHAICKQ